MDIINHQKDVADKVLEQIFPIDPFAICAGGAPRDWFFGKPAADLDIFLYTTVPQITIVHEMLEAVGIQTGEARIAEGLPEWYKLNPHLRCVFDTVVDDVPVQIMVMTEPTFKSVIPHFPFSICKVWYKHRNSYMNTNGVRLDRDFDSAEQHKIVVKTNTIYNDEHKYVQKIKAKFPEYRFFESWEEAKDFVFHKENN